MLQIYLSMVNTEEDYQRVSFIYENHYPLMCHCAKAILDDRDDYVQDAVHDAMVRIIDHLDRIDFSDPQRVKNLCGIITRNVAVDFLRKRSFIEENVDCEDILDITFSPGDIPDEILLNKETLDDLHSCLNKMDPKYRDVLIMTYVHNIREKDISSLLKIPQKTVYTRLTRAKQILLKALAKEGINA